MFGIVWPTPTSIPAIFPMRFKTTRRRSRSIRHTRMRRKHENSLPLTLPRNSCSLGGRNLDLESQLWQLRGEVEGIPLRLRQSSVQFPPYSLQVSSKIPFRAPRCNHEHCFIESMSLPWYYSPSLPNGGFVLPSSQYYVGWNHGDLIRPSRRRGNLSFDYPL